MESTTMSIVNEENLIFNEETARPSYCSLKADTVEEKAKLFNAVSSPDYKLRDMINKKIMIKDAYIEIIDCVNKETGEASQAPRTVIIDTEGKSYQCVSTGILNSLKRLFTVFGFPTYENGLPVEVRQVNAGQRQILTLVVAY